MIQCKTTFKLPEIFVVSSGRSGTTLLASILNASEQLYIPYESDFIARAYPHYHHRTSLNSEDYVQMAKMFRLSAKQEGWGLSQATLIEALETHSPQTFAEVNAAICETFHRQENTNQIRWGIKAPVLIASLERIHDVCPQAKIVHIVRDGRDVYLSYKKVHETSKIKFGPKGLIENALYWVDGLRRVEDFLKRHPDHPFYELRYDELLSEPERCLKALCQFLEIEYRPAMHEDFNQLERNKKVAPDVFRGSIHKKLSGGLDAKNTRKYLAVMSRTEQLKFELLAGPYLRKHGYQSEYPALNSIIFQPIRAIVHALARLFNNWRYNRRDRKIYQQASQSP